MIYKKHELSLSLNGDSVMHIARNVNGVVVFRENSEKGLKKAIDEYLKEQQYQADLAEQKKLEKEAKKAKQVEVVAEEPTVTEEPVVVEEVSSADETLVPQKRVTRGPDGKFISASAMAGSKSQLDTDEDLKKKTFWDKLTS